jgi:hypothetical protein
MKRWLKVSKDMTLDTPQKKTNMTQKLKVFFKDKYHFAAIYQALSDMKEEDLNMMYAMYMHHDHDMVQELLRMKDYEHITE